MESKTDIAWRNIFKKKKWKKLLKSSDYVTIDAETINKHRECRLMTKFDHYKTLPPVFKKCNVNILPISRSEFIIGKFNIYGKIGTIPRKPKFVQMCKTLESLPHRPEQITSEQTAISCAFAAGILSDFAHVHKSDMFPTLSGRAGSGDFSFKICGTGTKAIHEINVSKAQIELDAVFETSREIYLIEAKNHDCEDFVIRQLYYPYRYLRNIVKRKKKIIPVFMKYVNGTYYIYQYRFKKINELNSIEYVRGDAYTFVQEDQQRITTNEREALLRVRKTGEPAIPFPQADQLSRVEEIMNGLAGNGGSLSFQEIIAINLDFTSRQGDYYINAGKYLGLYSKGADQKIQLTEEGKRIQGLAYRERRLEIAKRILKAPVFSVCYRKLIQNGGTEIQDADIVAALIKYRPDLNPTTAGRRAQTVKAWLKWITNLVDE